MLREDINSFAQAALSVKGSFVEDSVVVDFLQDSQWDANLVGNIIIRRMDVDWRL